MQVLKGAIDFKSEPWPRISEAAKDCVRRLLDMDATKRATAEQVRGIFGMHTAWPYWQQRKAATAALISTVQGVAPCAIDPLPCCAALLQILKHDWLVKEGVALDIEMDSVVLRRMKQFAQMNKLKKMALMVVGQNLSPDELSGR